MTYGETIKQAREALRLTQEQLAEQLDVSRQAVSKWEADLSRPARGKLGRLSEILNIPPETWAEIDAKSSSPEHPRNAARPWKIATVCLTVLCLVLGSALAVLLVRESFPGNSVPAESTSELMDARSLAKVFSDLLPLSGHWDADFGDMPLEKYDASQVPFLNEPQQLQEQMLWEGQLDGKNSGLLHLCVVRANPRYGNGITFYDVFCCMHFRTVEKIQIGRF